MRRFHTHLFGIACAAAISLTGMQAAAQPQKPDSGTLAAIAGNDQDMKAMAISVNAMTDALKVIDAPIVPGKDSSKELSAAATTSGLESSQIDMDSLTPGAIAPKPAAAASQAGMNPGKGKDMTSHPGTSIGGLVDVTGIDKGKTIVGEIGAADIICGKCLVASTAKE